MDVEAEIARLRAASQLKEAATLAIESYGTEILSFLDMMLRSATDSTEAFAQACEDLWKGLPRFEGRASMKTWFYTLARHAASRQRRTARPERRASITEVSDVADRVRSQTQLHLKTEIKVGIAAIRATLNETDRMLLVLRVDRAMSWNDVARVMIEEDGDSSNLAITRAALRLRKRFQSVKEVIRTRAIAAGLVERDEA